MYIRSYRNENKTTISESCLCLLEFASFVQIMSSEYKLQTDKKCATYN
jgi:hypothetical protein